MCVWGGEQDGALDSSSACVVQYVFLVGLNLEELQTSLSTTCTSESQAGFCIHYIEALWVLNNIEVIPNKYTKIKDP